MKLKIEQTEIPNEFIFDISDFNYKTRLSFDLSLSEGARIEELVKELTREVTEIVKINLRLHLEKMRKTRGYYETK